MRLQTRSGHYKQGGRRHVFEEARIGFPRELGVFCALLAGVDNVLFTPVAAQRRREQDPSRADLCCQEGEQNVVHPRASTFHWNLQCSAHWWRGGEQRVVHPRRSPTEM